MTPLEESYRTIPLSKGVSTIVDVSDLPMIAPYSWHSGRNGVDGYFRAEAGITVDGKRKILRLSRLLMGLDFGDRRIVDHINGNPLDNRRRNLRVCTMSQNMMNRGKPRHNTSGIKGISWDRERGKWMAQIMLNRQRKHVGRFDDLEMAKQAYREACLKYHGEFGRIE